MSDTSKPKSKLEKLPEEQQAQLADWLLSGMPYWEAVKEIKKKFKISVSSSALTPFWNKVCVPQLIARRQRAVQTADEVGKEMEAVPGLFDGPTIDALKQKAFELAISPGANPKDVKAIFALVLKSVDQQQKAEALALERDKFEFDATEAALKHAEQLKVIAKNATLSERERMKNARQLLFGEKPEGV